MAKEKTQVEKIKPKRLVKKIAELTDSIGWVSFTPFQMAQLGIDPSKHTTSDLVNLVKDRLKIEKRPVKVVPTIVETEEKKE